MNHWFLQINWNGYFCIFALQICTGLFSSSSPSRFCSFPSSRRISIDLEIDWIVQFNLCLRGQRNSHIFASQLHVLYSVCARPCKLKLWDAELFADQISPLASNRWVFCKWILKQVLIRSLQFCAGDLALHTVFKYLRFQDSKSVFLYFRERALSLSKRSCVQVLHSWWRFAVLCRTGLFWLEISPRWSRSQRQILPLGDLPCVSSSRRCGAACLGVWRQRSSSWRSSVELERNATAKSYCKVSQEKLSKPSEDHPFASDFVSIDEMKREACNACVYSALILGADFLRAARWRCLSPREWRWRSNWWHWAATATKGCPMIQQVSSFQAVLVFRWEQGTKWKMQNKSLCICWGIVTEQQRRCNGVDA